MMTFFCLLFAMSENGVPILLIMLAMICDTILGVSGMTLYYALHTQP